MFPAEGFQPALSKLAGVLERLRIRFHLTGGITSVAYGEPRLTQDVDLVLDPDRVLAVRDRLLSALSEAGFFFDEQAARGAIASRRMFQIIDIDQVIKLDLYVRCLIPGELDRSARTELFPGPDGAARRGARGTGRERRLGEHSRAQAPAGGSSARSLGDLDGG